MQKNGKRYYLHYDQVGTLKLITDESGNVIKKIEYDSYGNILSDSNPDFKVPFGFAGGLYDSDTKLTRFGYRDYDSFSGRWTAKDPILFTGGDTNLYGYVLGDPVNFVDSEGLECEIYEGLKNYSTDVIGRGRDVLSILAEEAKQALQVGRKFVGGAKFLFQKFVGSATSLGYSFLSAFENAIKTKEDAKNFNKGTQMIIRSKDKKGLNPQFRQMMEEISNVD